MSTEVRERRHVDELSLEQTMALRDYHIRRCAERAETAATLDHVAEIERALRSARDQAEIALHFLGLVRKKL